MSKQHHDDGPIITIKDNNQNAAQHNPYSSTHNQVGLPDFTLQAHPIHVDCPHCHHSGMTKVEAKIGMLQWLLCLFLCLVGCYCCCCIPFWMSDLY